MAQIDFAVAFVVIFMMVSYSVFFVSNTLAKDFDHFAGKEIQSSKDSLVNQLFYAQDDKSLVSNFRKTWIVFEEVGDYSHTETLVLSTSPIVDRLHVYNLTMAEISSSYIDGNLSFGLGFSPNQKNYVNLIYDGSFDLIGYNNSQNITARILFEEEVVVLSQEKCSDLQAMSYDDAKTAFGVSHNFRIDDYCVYGNNPPADANVIVERLPMLIEDTDGTIKTASVTLKVW